MTKRTEKDLSLYYLTVAKLRLKRRSHVKQVTQGTAWINKGSLSMKQSKVLAQTLMKSVSRLWHGNRIGCK